MKGVLLAIALLMASVCGGSAAPVTDSNQFHVHVNTPGGSITSIGCTISVIASIIDEKGTPVDQTPYTFRWYDSVRAEGDPFFVGRQTSIDIVSGSSRTITVAARHESEEPLTETKRGLDCGGIFNG